MPKAKQKRCIKTKPYQLPKRWRCRDKYERAYQQSIKRAVADSGTTDGDGGTDDQGGGPVRRDSRYYQDANLILTSCNIFILFLLNKMPI